MQVVEGHQNGPGRRSLDEPVPRHQEEPSPQLGPGAAGCPVRQVGDTEILQGLADIGEGQPALHPAAHGPADRLPRPLGPSPAEQFCLAEPGLAFHEQNATAARLSGFRRPGQGRQRLLALQEPAGAVLWLGVISTPQPATIAAGFGRVLALGGHRSRLIADR